MTLLSHIILREDVAVSYKSLVSKSLLGLIALAPFAPASAQQVPAPGNELPPIIVPAPPVQGATLERGPVRPPAPTRTVGPSTALPAAPSVTQAQPADGTSAPSDIVLDSGLPTSALGTQVTVITADDIRRQNARRVPDVLKALPGVQVDSAGSVGSITQVRIRGAEGRHTRVVIDGIEANTTQNGEFDFSNLLTDDIERIEVIRGPMSSVYGAGALGGVINIVTRKAYGPPSLAVRAEVGSYGTRDISARLAAGSDAGYAALSVQGRQTNGFNISAEGAEKDETRLTNFALKAGLRLAPAARIDMTLRHSDKRAGYDDFGTVARLPFLTADDANNRLTEKSTLAGATLAWDMLDGKLTQELRTNFASTNSVNRYEPLLGFGAGFVNNTRDEGTRLLGGYSATYRTDLPAIGLKQAVTGLVEARRETYTPFSDFGFFDGDGLERSRRQIAYGAEWRGTFADRLTVIAGVRQEDNDTFVDSTTWRASLSYASKETGLRPHASAGTAVKLPGLYDQFGPNAQDYKSNPLLTPERSFGWDAGVEWSTMGGRALFDVTYFQQNLRDKITGFGGFDLTDFRSFTTNAAGESRRNGVELSSRYAYSPAISLGLAYTYTDARQPNGAPEVRRAPHSGRGDVRLAFGEGRGNASFVLSYNGGRPERVFDAGFASSTIQLPHYWLASVAVSYKIQHNVELYARVENALDQRYQEIYGYQTGRIAAYAGVKITFDDLLGVKK